MPKSREKINGLKLKKRRKVVKIILKNTISITLLRRKEEEKSCENNIKKHNINNTIA